MIAVLVAGAALLLSAAEGSGRERRPPDPPFERWAAETGPERQLDRLIGEVVATLEGDGRFSQWRSRDIRAEFGMLRLAVPQTTEARYRGSNFLFDSSDFGIHFRARFGLPRLRFFVPSACRERVRAGRRGDEVRARLEGWPHIDSAHGLTEPDYRARYSSIMTVYEMECGDSVRIRFYDSAAENRRGRSDRPAEAWNAVDHYWTGVTIFRAAD